MPLSGTALFTSSVTRILVGWLENYGDFPPGGIKAGKGLSRWSGKLIQIEGQLVFFTLLFTYFLIWEEF